MWPVLIRPIQARFVLNSRKDWHNNDGDWKGRKFSSKILTILMQDEDFYRETLEWFDE